MKKKHLEKKGKNTLVFFFLLLAFIFIFLLLLFFFSNNQSKDNLLPENQISEENLTDFENKEEKSFQNTSEEKDFVSSENTEDFLFTEETIKTEESFSSPSIEIPLCPATRKDEEYSDHEVHSYSGFTLCYRESYEDAEWVSYILTSEKTNAITSRTDDFRTDVSITTLSASPADYRGSGYDRGHLAPAADMEWSKESVSESFLMSNMTPQTPGFNRGVWKKLESKVRQWAKDFGEITVVTGPVLEKEASFYKTIGENCVAVPEYFYKVLLAKKITDGEEEIICIGFIIPNENTDLSFMDFAVSVDEVEKRTGLDFFSALPDDVEEKTESVFNSALWK